MKRIVTIWSSIFSILTVAAQVTHMTPLTNGTHCTLQDSSLLRVEFVTPDIVRVRYTCETDFVGNGTDICLPRTPEIVPYRYTQTAQEYSLQSDSLTVTINKNTGAIAYYDHNGSTLLHEDEKHPHIATRIYDEKVIYNRHTRHIEKTADGEKVVASIARRDTVGTSWSYRIGFKWQSGEALYGLGSHMEDYMNLRGKTLYLCQHNLKAMVPVLNSTAGYGLLFDAGCGMIYNDQQNDSYMELAAARQIDYYFMKGKTPDDVVAQYRRLTGNVPMLPRYILGYIQSKERYGSSEELMSVVNEYRKRQIPLDVIVQDWCYWPQGWGYMKMNPKFYPDVRTLTDSLHAMHTHMMLSIWPNMSNCPQADDFAARGFMLTGDVYDTFNPLARQYYWSYANREFFDRGIDAWWCDCTEPVDADWNVAQDFDPTDQKLRWKRNVGRLSDVLGAERSCLFSLYHSRGIYENQRAATAAKRVVNLTRSSYAGQQRYATITWNGDTHASWASFAQQIPAGLNFMATGCPYWTIDIGAFFARSDPRWFYAGEYDQGVADMGYRELYVRMFQFGAFLPLFRSHGTDTPREVWQFGKSGDPMYESLLSSIRLRYRLLPYLYSLVAGVTREAYTPVRLLAFDFAADAKVLDLKDEMMFGPSILVCPVTKPMYYVHRSQPLDNTPRTRSVYLPQGCDWIDFYTGQRRQGGQTLEADAPIDRLPLYVRCGSIIPLGPQVQYADEAPDAPWEIRIYPGADADFTIYEDKGDGYEYEQGASASYRMHWNDKKQCLQISERSGQYDGMTATRELRLVVVSDHLGIGGSPVETPTRIVRYSGKALSVRLKQ